MALNNEGTILATASDKGTIVRVFSVPDAHKLYQFRRGSMPSRIYSMSFNVTSTLLCVSSATETIHIFKLGPQGPVLPDDPSSPMKSPNFLSNRRMSQSSESPLDPAEDGEEQDTAASLTARKPNASFMGMIRRTSQNVGTSLATTMGGYLPKGVAEMWEPARDFAWIRLPKASAGTSAIPGSMRSVVAMSSNTPQVMVVTNEGNFYVYSIDLVKGGEGTLTKQYS